MTAATIHDFERAGLGVAPFQFVEAYEKRGPLDMGNGHMVGAPGQPMGTCAFCGTGIAICCVILDANGTRFEVGSECVRRTYAKGSRVLTNVERAVREIQRKNREAKFRERLGAGRARLETDEALRAEMDRRKHPNADRAARGDTRLSWALWMLQNAGTQGRTEVLDYMDKLSAWMARQEAR